MTRADLHEGLHEHYRTLLPDGLRPAAGGMADGYVAVIARVLGLEVEAASAMILDWFPQTASPQALDVIGNARGLRRYPDEYLEAWRNRVVNAYEFWAKAGTVPGMLAALEHLGYGVVIRGIEDDGASGVFQSGSDGGVKLMQASGSEVQPSSLQLEVDGETFDLDTLIVPEDFAYYAFPPTRIIEHYHESTEIWAEFSLVITPSNSRLTAPAWGSGLRWGSGSLWGMSIKASEVARILAVINEIKPAHARLRALYLVSAAAPHSWGDGTRWGDGTYWGVGRPSTLWQREGI